MAIVVEQLNIESVAKVFALKIDVEEAIRILREDLETAKTEIYARLDELMATKADLHGNTEIDFNTKNLFVNGDLTITGVLNAVNRVIMEVEDAFIILNKGELGAGVTNITSGLEIDRGTLPSAKLFFTEQEACFKLGITDTFYRIATEVDISNLLGEINSLKFAVADLYSQLELYATKAELDVIKNDYEIRFTNINLKIASITANLSGYATKFDLEALEKKVDTQYAATTNAIHLANIEITKKMDKSEFDTFYTQYLIFKADTEARLKALEDKYIKLLDRIDYLAWVIANLPTGGGGGGGLVNWKNKIFGGVKTLLSGAGAKDFVFPTVLPQDDFTIISFPKGDYAGGKVGEYGAKAINATKCQLFTTIDTELTIVWIASVTDNEDFHTTNSPFLRGSFTIPANTLTNTFSAPLPKRSNGTDFFTSNEYALFLCPADNTEGKLGEWAVECNAGSIKVNFTGQPDIPIPFNWFLIYTGSLPAFDPVNFPFLLIDNTWTNAELERIEKFVDRLDNDGYPVVGTILRSIIDGKFGDFYAVSTDKDQCVLARTGTEDANTKTLIFLPVV